MRNAIKKVLSILGYTIKKYPDDDLRRRMKIIQYYKIDTLFDIGANVGQYASKMREIGFKDKIVSFEPLKSAFKTLQEKSSNDNNWIINNYALGDENTVSVINVSENSVFSSIMPILSAPIENDSQAKTITKEQIEIKKIDSIFNIFCNDSNNVMIKIDTQGFEKNVIDGAIESLKKIKIIQLEMSIVPLYENELLVGEMIKYLEDKGFKLFSLENGFSNPINGQLMQVDGIFVNL